MTLTTFFDKILMHFWRIISCGLERIPNILDVLQVVSPRNQTIMSLKSAGFRDMDTFRLRSIAAL
jgi:hypothetical protein